MILFTFADLIIIVLGIGIVLMIIWGHRRRINHPRLKDQPEHNIDDMKSRVFDLRTRANEDNADMVEENLRIERIRIVVENLQRGRYGGH